VEMVAFKQRPTRSAQRLRRNATEAEKRLWIHLSRRQLGRFKFSRQMPVGPFICDFLCREAKLVVEVDGGQHSAQHAADEARTRFLTREGYRVIRFWNNDVLENTDGVLANLLEAMRLCQPHPRPLPRAGGEQE
jgi:very-short-patch-repair endonuclease